MFGRDISVSTKFGANPPGGSPDKDAVFEGSALAKTFPTYDHKLVPVLGIEPRLTGSKPVVLPLDDSGMAPTAGFEPATLSLTGTCSTN